jgi:succinoglycan biosynthesis transport protein ExoP
MRIPKISNPPCPSTLKKKMTLMSNEASDNFDLGEEDESTGLPAQLRDPIGVLRRQYRWIVTTLILMLALVAGATALFPLRYESQATILLTAKSIPDEFVPTTIIASIVEQFEAIRNEVFSRNHLSEIIQETGVYADKRTVTTQAELVERLKEELIAEPVGQTSGRSRGGPSSIAFQISMRGKQPQILADVVNTTIAHLINENVKYRSRQARITTEFMQREYERADAALRDHQRKLGEFREMNRGALPEERTTAISRLDRLEEQRRSAILRLSDFQTRLEHLDARPEIMGTGQALDSLHTQLRKARTLYTADHPRVRSLERQVSAMESAGSTGKTLGNIRRSDERSQIQEGAASEQRRLSQIDQEVAQLESLLAKTPQISEEYAALVRLEQILQENYVEYLRKLKSAELALSLESAQQGAQLKRIDSAIAPTTPVIARWQIAGGGLVVALGLSLLVAIVRELVNPVIIDEQHLEESLPIPLLGSIAKIA